MAARGRAAGSERPGDIMKGTVRTALILLLIPLCAGQTTSAEKPGDCPPLRYITPGPGQTDARWCTTDFSCPGDKKCCPYNEGVFCTSPAEDRDGECPQSEATGDRCTDYCTSDSECAPGLKCCFKGCGNTCVPAMAEKSGSCPPSKSICMVGSHYTCKEDQTCTGTDKCCIYECGKKCLPAE